MRRPLLAVCLVLTGVLSLYCLVLPPPVSGYEEWDGREAAVYGTIDRKEYRTSYGSSQLLLYISDVSITDTHVSDTSITDTFKSDLPNSDIFTEDDFRSGILCYMESAETEPCIGSRVWLRGRLESFSAGSNPGEFDSRMYYAAMGIGMRMMKTEILWESKTCSVVRENLWRLRRLACDKLDSFLTKEDASVMKAMLAGDKETLDSVVKELYQRSGIAHILAVSGLHISLIGMGVYRLLRKSGMPIPIAAVLCMALILLYGILTGDGVSVRRASGMFLLRMLAEMLGRTYDMQTALGVMLAFMALRQPLYLFHSGFLFSFSSLMGIGLLYPALRRERRRGRRYRSGWGKRAEKAGEKVHRALLASCCVTMATLPVQLWYYGEFPVYGIFLNLLVLPLMTVLMYCGMLLLVFPAGIWLKLPAFLIHEVLQFYESLCRGMAEIPGNTWIIGRPVLWRIVLYTAALAGIVLWRKKISSRCLPVILTVCLGVLTLGKKSGFQVTFLDVGQGDGICIQTGGGQNYLVDGGSSSKRNTGQYQILPFLKHQGIGYLDAFFVTHPDADHCNGLDGLLEGGYGNRIGRLILPDIALGSRDENYIRLEALAAAYGIPVSYLSAGTCWQDGEVEFRCLHPPAGYAEMDSNEYSQVLYVKYGLFSMLLTGDIEAEGERLLTEQMRKLEIGNVTVLKVAHHGSSSSTGSDFLRRASPLIAVISCGKDNSYGHPHEETLEKLRGIGTMIFQTPECGAVIVQEDGSGITVRTIH